MNKKSSVRLESDIVGRGKILIDDHDISDAVKGVSINIQPGNHTQMILDINFDDLDSEIEAEIMIPSQVDFSGIDADVIESRALERMGWNGNGLSLTATVILIIEEMLNGD